MERLQERSLDAADAEIRRWQEAAEACCDALAEADADLTAAQPEPSRLFWRRRRARRRWTAELARYEERVRAARVTYEPYAEKVADRCRAYEQDELEVFLKRRSELVARFEKWCEARRTDSRLAGKRRWRIVTTDNVRRVAVGGKSDAYAVAARDIMLTPEAHAAIAKETGADPARWWTWLCDTVENRRALEAALRTVRTAITETSRALADAGHPNAVFRPGDTTLEPTVTGWTVTFNWAGMKQPSVPGPPAATKEVYGRYVGAPFGHLPSDALLTVNGKLAKQRTAYPGNDYLRHRRRWYETGPDEYTRWELDAKLTCHDLSEYRTRYEIPVPQLLPSKTYVPYIEGVAAVMSAGFRGLTRRRSP